MRRRTVLGLTAAGACGSLSGCLGRGGQSATQDSDDDSQDDTDSTEQQRHSGTAAIESVNINAAQDFRVSAEVVAQATAESPAKVRASLTNISDSDVDVQFGRTEPFSGYIGQHLKGGINAYLSPIDVPYMEYSHPHNDENTYVAPEKSVNGCWELDGMWWEAGTQTSTVEAGQTVSHMYKLWGDGNASACFPTGTYRFVDNKLLGSGSTWELDIRME